MSEAEMLAFLCSQAFCPQEGFPQVSGGWWSVSLWGAYFVYDRMFVVCSVLGVGMQEASGLRGSRCK